MHHFLRSFVQSFSDEMAYVHLLIGLQFLVYFFVGRSLFALLAGRTRDPLAARSRYTLGYVPVGALAWHFLAFLMLFAGVPSLRLAHLLALAPFVVVGVWRRRAMVAFPIGRGLLMLALVAFIFIPVGTGLFHALAQSWDEFTHWASRAKQIFLLDRLPDATDPVVGVAPFYGLYATLISVCTYLLVGKESVGAATAWSFLFALIISIHMFEFLRAHEVSPIIGVPVCAWFISSLTHDQWLLTATLYADIHTLVGGALASLHMCAVLAKTASGENATEDGLFASAGLGILLFTKTTSDVTAGCVCVYAGALLIGQTAAKRDLTLFKGGLRVIGLVLLPALLLRGLWWLYTARALPNAEDLMCQLGTYIGVTMWNPHREPLLLITRQVFGSLMRQQPYQILLVALPLCWLVDLLLRRFSRPPRRGDSLGMLSLWMPLILCTFIAVFYFTYGSAAPERSFININRYASASLPAGVCYAAAVVHRFVTWMYSASRRILSASMAKWRDSRNRTPDPA
jgi:hypothetical protein